VNNIDEFVTLIRDQFGLPVTVEDVGLGLDELPGWDSVHLLALLTLLEHETGRAISMPDVLQAPSLRKIYDLAVEA